MTVNELAAVLNAEKTNVCDGNRQIETGYAGDLLSFVMGRAPTNCAWFTVMTNVNICAVAALADVSVVVVCENSQPMPEAVEKAVAQGINLIVTEYDIFTAIKRYLDENQV